MKRKRKENKTKIVKKKENKPSEKKEKGKQTKLTEYCKTTTSKVSEKQATSSSESLSPEKSKRSSIHHDAFVTPPRTRIQIQASTPESPDDLFCANISKDKHLSLEDMDQFNERMAELPGNTAGSTDLLAGALSPATRPVPGISQLTKTKVTLDVHQEEGSSQNQKDRKRKCSNQ